MGWHYVEQRIDVARCMFLMHDTYLLRCAANERSMTHKFAGYLQQQFPRWHVDCEYNRQGAATKRLGWLAQPSVHAADLDARSVYPDIIVHQRGFERNLLVMEAKKLSSEDSDYFEQLAGSVHDRDDEEKLTAFVSAMAYSHAVILKFVTGERPDILFWRIPTKRGAAHGFVGEDLGSDERNGSHDLTVMQASNTRNSEKGQRFPAER